MSNRPETTITGRIVHLTETRNVGKDSKPTRTVVIDSGDKYPAPTPVEYYGDKAALLNGAEIGADATARAYVSGREWQGKYYPQLRGYQFEHSSSVRSDTSARTNEQPPAQTQRASEQTDDLPF